MANAFTSGCGACIKVCPWNKPDNPPRPFGAPPRKSQEGNTGLPLKELSRSPLLWRGGCGADGVG